MLGPRLTTRISRRLLGAAVWGLLVGGLFAMHGLGTHGSGSHGEMAQQAVSEVSEHVGMHAAGHPASGAPETTSTSPGEHSSALIEPIGPGAVTGLMALCLAILAGILAAFAAVLLGHLRRRPLARTTPAVRAIVIAGRDRDPPCLLRLSVMRC